MAKPGGFSNHVVLLLWHLLFIAPSLCCIPRERAALLSFKAGIVDRQNVLSSWRGQDCCGWRGVTCSNRTGHVVKLNLRNTDLYPSAYMPLSGEISPSLLALRHLNYLDLSWNNFSSGPIPKFIGSLEKLRYLNLTRASFIGAIPPQLGNLSRLQYLDIRDNNMYSVDLSWLPRLASLKYLDMSYVNLSAVLDWVQVVNMLPSLQVLRLSRCRLYNKTIASLPRSNLTALANIDLGRNNFLDIASMLDRLGNIVSLKYVNLEGNLLSGPFPDALGNLTSLEVLQLSDNRFVGLLPGTWKNLCNLRRLDLASNPVNRDITEFMQTLPRCARSKLETLELEGTNLFGNISKNCLEDMTGLITLNLAYNMLNGSIPPSIGKLELLAFLDLSNNSFCGVISEDHFARLTRLKFLILSNNPLTIRVNPTWVPPFRLEYADFRSCKLGPHFPAWLQNQTIISFLDLSDTGISGPVPSWFWNEFSQTISLDLSNNQIVGRLPAALKTMSTKVMDLSSNQLEGPLPQLPANLSILDLSNNRIGGTIPSSLCQLLESLQSLDLSNNLLSGMFPPCSTDSEMAGFAGVHIEMLNLSNNSLVGTFPSLLRNSQNLDYLDLAYNKFSGILPAWIGEKLSSLRLLRLRNNIFSGPIPLQLTKLALLKVLDVAHNNLSGKIPPSLANLKSMALPYSVCGTNSNGGCSYIVNSFWVTMKGQERKYAVTFFTLMVSIDLSSNNLQGGIPEEIGALVALNNLNLSRNHLSGNIPRSIGKLQSLESLDLSNNELSGAIPPSISNFTSLGSLNLSYNNLSGQIPLEGQLHTFNNSSIYIGNPGLCGPPLSDDCLTNRTSPSTDLAEHKGEVSDAAYYSFYCTVSVGFVTGLWVVFVTFLFIRTWRVAYFRFVDNMYDWLYVQVAVNWARLMRKINTMREKIEG